MSINKNAKKIICCSIKGFTISVLSNPWSRHSQLRSRGILLLNYKKKIYVIICWGFYFDCWPELVRRMMALALDIDIQQTVVV
jgi:hypothetical protein